MVIRKGDVKHIILFSVQENTDRKLTKYCHLENSGKWEREREKSVIWFFDKPDFVSRTNDDT